MGVLLILYIPLISMLAGMISTVIVMIVRCDVMSCDEMLIDRL